MKIDKQFLLKRGYLEEINDLYNYTTYRLSVNGREVTVKFSSMPDSSHGFDVCFGWQRIPFCKTQDDLIALERICLGEK